MPGVQMAQKVTFILQNLDQKYGSNSNKDHFIWMDQKFLILL